MPIEPIRPNSYKLVPIEPYYQARFYFTLKDEDGFVMLKLTSEGHSIEPGKANSFQDLVGDTIPIKIASRTTEVILNIDIRKCL